MTFEMGMDVVIVVWLLRGQSVTVGAQEEMVIMSVE